MDSIGDVVLVFALAALAFAVIFVFVGPGGDD